MIYTSVKSCFLFYFYKKNCKGDFFTPKYAKNRRFHSFSGLFPPETTELRLVNSAVGAKSAKRDFTAQSIIFHPTARNFEITSRSGSLPPG